MILFATLLESCGLQPRPAEARSHSPRLIRVLRRLRPEIIQTQKKLPTDSSAAFL